VRNLGCADYAILAMMMALPKAKGNAMTKEEVKNNVIMLNKKHPEIEFYSRNKYGCHFISVHGMNCIGVKKFSMLATVEQVKSFKQ